MLQVTEESQKKLFGAWQDGRGAGFILYLTRYHWSAEAVDGLREVASWAYSCSTAPVLLPSVISGSGMCSLTKGSNVCPLMKINALWFQLICMADVPDIHYMCHLFCWPAQWIRSGAHAPRERESSSALYKASSLQWTPTGTWFCFSGWILVS